jgi:hypothetical protein
MGLVFTNTTPLCEIEEAKAAPEEGCDYIFLHLRTDQTTAEPGPGGKVTLKTFLEPLRLLQRRLHLLIRNANATEHDIVKLSAAELLPKLLELDKDEDSAADTESWEDLGGQIDGINDVYRRREGGEEVVIRVDQ